ncbi:MAG: hypothetical protein ABR537_05440 [Gemmatimonadales bacterium]
MKRLLPLLLLLGACSRGRGGSPTCGIAFLAGPSMITQQLTNARAVLTDPPRGLPDSLPALVILQKSRDIGATLVGRDAEGKISIQYRGVGFPARGYGLLVVDDTSQRAMGVLVLDAEEPQDHPAIGTIIGGSTALSLYGVRVDWASVSNPRCPLFGGTAPPTS